MDQLRPIIVVAERMNDDALRRLRAAGDVRLLESYDQATLIAAVTESDALVIRSYAQASASVIAAGKRLRVIGRAGVGLENVDVAAAAARGVRVVHTPAAATMAVAEHTVALMLAVERRLVHGDAMVRADKFLEARSAYLSRDLHACTLGVVGMGRIGRAVGKICHDGFGMRVLHNDIVDVEGLAFESEAVSKERLYGESDVVTLHVPLTRRTRGLIDAQALGRFKISATLINTSRGAVVCADALTDALRDGRLGGAGLDVHDPEPPRPGHPLLSAPNVVFSPHVAARTASGLAGMNDVVDDVIAVLEGRSPAYPVG